MAKVNLIKLSFTDKLLSKDPINKKWLKTCEIVINNQLKKLDEEFLGLDLFTNKEVWFTTKRKST